MNPLTNVKNIQKLSEQELKRSFKTSWHDQYRDSAWVFIGGLPYDLTEGDVICVFSQYGEVVNLNLVRDKSTGKSKGFCFLCYEDQRSTVLAVDNFNGMKILGRIIRVDHVTDYKPPKESKNIDDVTKLLYETGCAPGTSVLSVNTPEKQEEKPDSKEGILKKLKKEKKKKPKKQKVSKKKSSKKKKRRKKKKEETSSSSPSSSDSSESSSETSSESSSSEESEEEVERPKDKSRPKEKNKPVGSERELQNGRDAIEKIKVKMEEEEEEKRRARREERTKEQRVRQEGERGEIRGSSDHRGNQRNETKCEQGHSFRSLENDASTSRWGSNSEGKVTVRVGKDSATWKDGECSRDDDRRKRYDAHQKEDRRYVGEDRGGLDRRWHKGREENWRKAAEGVRDDGRGRREKEERGRDERGRRDDRSQRKDEYHESDSGRRGEKRRQNEQSYNPGERESGKSKRSH